MPLLVTIFLGANDACLPPSSAHVPTEEFSAHIRCYIDTVLNAEATRGTNVLLITPPPINARSPEEGDDESYPPVVRAALARDELRNLGYLTWCSKRKYARRIVEIGKEYEGKTDLVAVLDFWTILSEYGLQEARKKGWVAPQREDGIEVITGCGLKGAPEFGIDVFTDRLHLGPKVSVATDSAVEF